MEKLIKTLQKLQLRAHRKGIDYTINVSAVDTTVTDVTVNAFHSTVSGTELLDSRNFRATFSSENNDEDREKKLGALTKFINDIRK